MSDDRRIFWGLRGAIAAALVLGAFSPAAAQSDFPSRTIKIVVPIPAGAAADTLPRIVADRLAARWGQPVIIENRPGAASNLGAEVVAKAEPDGYTLLATPPGPLVISQHFYAKLGFDPTAFTPVSIIATIPRVLVVHPKVPVSSLQELIGFAKAHPDKLNCASAGIGSPPHLAAEMLKAKAGIRFTHVPYKGLAPAMTDLLAGHVDMMFDNLGNALPHIQAGRLKALGVGSDARIAELPDVPALSALVPGFVDAAWFAVVAPPKTPPEIAAKLSQAIAEIVKRPDVEKQFQVMSAVPIGSSPLELAAFMKEESERWRAVITSAGIKAN